MASIIRDIPLRVGAGAMWSALRDVGGVARLFPGVLTGSRIEGPDRIVTFAEGLVARERILARDDANRRLAYTVVGGRPTHHHASFQVFDAPAGGCRVRWISDFLPDELEPAVRALMDQGAQALRRAMEAGR